MKRCVARCLSGIFLVLAVHLSASGVSCAQQPKKGGTLVYASVSGPGTLDPYVASSLVELEVINNVFEGLVTLDAKNATRTMLASKATASEDFKTYSFELRKGVKFHNGQEMTSADVKGSLERHRRDGVLRAVGLPVHPPSALLPDRVPGRLVGALFFLLAGLVFLFLVRIY